MWLEKPARGIFLWAQALVTSLNSMLHAQHDPPIHKHFLRNLNLGCVG